MFRKLYFIFLIFSFLPVLSCVESRHFSSQVDVQMCGATRRAGDQIVCAPSPIVRFKGQEDIICRRGLPEPFTTPWDELRAQQGEEATGGASQQDEERKSSIFLSVSDYWFKVFPVIRNRSAYHLVIEEINFKVKSSGADTQVTDKPFQSGYCETTPFLYILNPGTSSEGERGACARTQSDRDKGIPNCNEGSYTTYSDFARSYVMGNLAFYLDGLPAPPEVNTNDSNFTTLRIPNYSVNWEIRGIFYTIGGEQVGSLQKTGYFRTQRSSF